MKRGWRVSAGASSGEAGGSGTVSWKSGHGGHSAITSSFPIRGLRLDVSWVRTELLVKWPYCHKAPRLIQVAPVPTGKNRPLSTRGPVRRGQRLQRDNFRLHPTFAPAPLQSPGSAMEGVQDQGARDSGASWLFCPLSRAACLGFRPLLRKHRIKKGIHGDGKREHTRRLSRSVQSGTIRIFRKGRFGAGPSLTH